ncbi:dihydroorotase [Chitinimonas sp. BJB300]|uniref:dihydroorotase n=1 Tax=Chitinimonas sp. BJB300 TaxID=1559339 RepID=UPI000C0DA4AF|nr:dihydroorotase [Chitinimonas sp. BJB300]PHV11776.1 dihydroorotase [Chitinimonas sp. BJB300]TSJ91226.1 dihydroorotase [Chitinimonas sp. BJB300]
MNMLIQNGRVIDPASGFDSVTDLYLDQGRIVAIGAAPAGFKEEITLDAKGLTVMPGLVDLAARLGEPGGEHKNKLQSELKAAVAGGVTTLCAMPDTKPALDQPSLVQMLRQKTEALGLARVLPLGALTRSLEGTELTEFAKLREAGCVAFSQADAPLADTRVLYRAMQYAATYGIALRLRPQDVCLAAGGVAHDGQVATRLGLPAVPAVAETVAIATIVILMRDSGACVHLERISTQEGVAMIAAARADGLKLTCDVSINHVHLADTDIGYFDSNMRLSPPLRSVRDRDAIQQGLLDGTITAICSDHTPVGNDDKLLPFGEAAAGATGLEILLPLVLAWAEQKQIALPIALAKITSAPAMLLGLEAGQIKVGAPADLCIFDAHATWRVAAETLISNGKHTPFVGVELRGRVQYTLVGGHIAYTEPGAA